MIRKIELGPIIVLLAALLLLVSLFVEWYGPLNAWDAFEVVDVLLATLAVVAVLTAAGTLAPGLAYVERRRLPLLVLAVVVLIVAEIIDPPPAAADLPPDTGAWLAFAAAAAMLVGAVLSLGRVSFAIAIESRDPQRVAAVDQRPDAAAAAPAAATTPAAAAPAASAASAASAAPAAAEPEPTAPTTPAEPTRPRNRR
jgi:cell division septation protein DedD